MLFAANLLLEGASTLDLGRFFANCKKAIENWGGAFIGMVGAFMLLVAAIMIAKAFMEHGRGQTNWMMLILMICVGGAMFVGGFDLMKKLADVGQGTITVLSGNGEEIKKVE